MSAIVIKSWKASDIPLDDKGTFVSIQGRQGGLISWLLALMGIDPVTSLRVTGERAEWKQASLEGWKTVVLPLENVDYIFHGYHNPWKKALVLFLFFLVVLPPLFIMLLGVPVISGMLGLTVSLASGLLYFFLSRSFVIGLAATGGEKFSLKFKRSVVEAQEINAKEAEYICDMVDYLCDCRRHKAAA